MREILFRAKRLDNGEWVYWNIWGELLRESGKRTRIAVQKDATTSYYDYIYQIRHLIDPDTICQFTGLLDKNGKKIWENDIISMKYVDGLSVGAIRYRIDNVRFVYHEFGNGDYGFDNTCEIEVIGNIFDNPELLKGGE